MEKDTCFAVSGDVSGSLNLALTVLGGINTDTNMRPACVL